MMINFTKYAYNLALMKKLGQPKIEQVLLKNINNKIIIIIIQFQ